MVTVPFLIEWAIRSAVLIASTAVLLKLLRPRDPAVRLAVWTAVLFGSLALPLVHRTAPAIPVAAPVATALPPAVAAEIAPLILAVETAPAEPAPTRFDWSRAAVAIYLAGAGLILLRMAIGLLLGWRILRRSRRTERAGIRESAGLSSPAVLGILRPAIVLPARWREWDTGKLAAVLAHERSHIRRRDPAVQLLAAVHRAVLWFSPPAWYLERQIVRLAEEASDDAAIAAIADRVSYAEVLLDFLRGARPAKWQGVPMARYTRPEWRIDRILDGAFLSRGLTRWGAAAIVALAAPAAYLIAAAQATEPSPKFEVASVKPATPPEGITFDARSGSMAFSTDGNVDPQRWISTGGPGTKDPGRIHYPLASLKKLLNQAFEGYFEVEAPDWAGSNIVAVDATLPAGASREQFHEMIRNLLIDRFQLRYHVASKPVKGYDLVVARNGLKLKEAVEMPASADSGKAPSPPRRGEQIGPDGFPVLGRIAGGFAVMAMPVDRARIVGQQQTMASLAGQLGKLLNAPVRDSTGLTAQYDITLSYAGRMSGGPNGAQALLQGPPPSSDPAAPEPLPDIFSAVQSQLGLRLEPKQVTVDTIVIDHLEKNPIGN